MLNMLELRNITKSYLSHSQVLKNISLKIPKGKFVSLLGPSGCGKSTLLRIISGLEEPTSGVIYWDDKNITSMVAQFRPFNMVFQKHALFPHLTIFENIAFGLKIKKQSPAIIKSKVEKYLSLVGLSGFEDRYPGTLSGGQSQRVALARALINEPQILLLDEPLSALDVQLREQMQKELKKIQLQLGITFILVTHDQDEAFSLSENVIVMNGGVVEQIGAPIEIISEPKTQFVADFVCGDRQHLNKIEGKILEIQGDKAAIEISNSNTVGTKIWGTITDTSLRPGTRLSAFIRPDKILFNLDLESQREK